MDQDPRRVASRSPHTDTTAVSITTAGTLDRWLSYPWDNGVQVDQLEDLTALHVETQNSTYDLAIVAARAGEILVRGGRYFPDWTPAQLVGCSLGGGLLKRHGVHVGFTMELYSGGRLILTSPVRAINLGPAVRSDMVIETVGPALQQDGSPA